MSPMGNFCFVFLILRNPTNGDQRNCWRYMSHGWFSLTHVLVSGGPSEFLRGQKAAILGTLFNKVFKWQLTMPQLGGIWEIENNRVHHWLSDYIHPKFGVGQLNSQREPLMQIRWGRSSLGWPAMLLAAWKKIGNPKQHLSIYPSMWWG